jgi:leucyl aminopeptidase
MLNKKKVSILFIIILCIISLGARAKNISPLPFSGYGIHYSDQVNSLFNQINPQEMWTNLTVLTSFPDRASYHDTGVQAANWLKTQVETMIQISGRKDAIVYTIETNGKSDGGPYSSPQPSLVLRIGDSSEAGVVIGAHFDSVGCIDEGCVTDPNGPLPGADDDGSGTVTVLELARTLLTSGMNFKKPMVCSRRSRRSGLSICCE